MIELTGVALGRRRAARLDTLLDHARRAALTYDHVGSTVGDAPFPRPVHRHSIEVDGTLEAARGALRRWATHDGIGAAIVPEGAPLEVGTTLLVVAALGPCEMAVPDRVVAVVDDHSRVGFAYGTLDGHAERGEELFLAERLDPGRLRLSIVIHARPATVLARLGRPIVGVLQRAAGRRYLAAWAAAIADP